MLKPENEYINLYEFLLQHCEDDGSILTEEEIFQFSGDLSALTHWSNPYGDIYSGFSRMKENINVFKINL